MTTIDTLKINSPDIVSETIDGEVVIVNLQQGHYYSLLNTATEMWNKIEQGTNRESLIKELLQHYETTEEEVSKHINKFIEALEAENLITVETIEKPKYQAPKLTQLPNPTQKQYFQSPEIQKFTDMEDLLLIDPIHEVDEEAGWPNIKDAAV